MVGKRELFMVWGLMELEQSWVTQRAFHDYTHALC